MSEVPNDIQKLSFEKALAELEEIVDNLESGSTDLEKSIEFYTRGSYLKAHCQQKLDDAVLKLEEIKLSSDGKVSKKEIDKCKPLKLRQFTISLQKNLM